MGGGREREEGGKGKHKKDDEKVPLWKLFSFADASDVGLMAVGAVAAAGNGFSLPAMTFLFGDLVNAFGVADESDVVHRVTKVVIKFLYLAAGTGIASFLQVSCWMATGERQAARIRGLYLKTILRQDIVFFDKETTTGEVIGRMSGDTILIQDAIGEKVGKFIQLVVTFFGGFVIAFTRGWLLSLVLLTCIPLVILAGVFMVIIQSRLSARAQASYADAGSVVEQTTGSIRTVASFNGEKEAVEKYNRLIKVAYRSAVREGAAAGLGLGSVLFIVFSSYGLAVWYGSKLIMDRHYTGGEVFNVMIAIMTGGSSLSQCSPCVKAFAAGRAAAYKMFQTIKRKPEIDSYETKGIELDDINGVVELRNVRFSYPARPENLIFDGFSLHVPRGKTMALVGESGSGKSTVISLVERFYDPDSGVVLIDGINLKEFRLRWIREKIGLVSQEPVLFTTTIRENIAYGKDNASSEEIQRVIELANAAKFIDKLPNGLDTMVGEHGTLLSGGQKQRIAIARAILKNPKILLLDEATSALDAESERIVQEALLRLMQGRTTIVVAHRLSTIKTADTISVLHRGKLIEQGSHAELTEDPNGAYSQLIRLQEIGGSELEEEKWISDMEAERSNSVWSVLGRRPSEGWSRQGSRHLSEGGSNRPSSSAQLDISGSLSQQREVGGDGDFADPLLPEKKVSIWQVAYLNKPELPILMLGSIAAAVHGTIFPLFGFLMSSAIQSFYKPPDELRKDATKWALLYVGLGGVVLLTVPVQYSLFNIAGGRLIKRIRSLSFERVVHQEISWFDEPENSSGAIGARLSVDASSLKMLVGDTLGLMLQNLSTLVAGFVIAMVANWKLALVITVIIPLVGLQGFAQMRSMKGFSKDAKAMYEEASQVANDAVGSIRTVASFCAEQRVMDIYESKCKVPKKHGVRTGIISGLGYGFSFVAVYCTYTLVFYVGAKFMESGHATFGQVFKVFFALTLAAIGISQASAIGPDASKARDSAASIFRILDRRSKIDASKEEEGVTLEHVRGEINFRHVSFRYPTRPDVQIFQDLCLRIPPGKYVALVGESGSGKSTAIALLERFYDVDSGAITLDGVELRRLKLGWLRRQMGLVSQEPVLFNDTVRANIAYGKQGGAGEEAVVAAAEAAGAHGFISAMPDGYETLAGERGVQLSGGQKQRIAIARAVLKDPRVLLLDEATSALDAESERAVQEALDRAMVGRTTVSIAHRLSTIVGADIIAVIKNGVVAEMGRHEELIKIAGGAYASLVSLHSSGGGAAAAK